jgi:hypothetical protein
MNLRHRQRGLGLWGWIFVLGVIGFFAMVTLQLIPIYLAELSIQRVVKATAQDQGNAGLPLPELRRSMRTRWDVEGITTLDMNQIKLVKHGASGRALAYEYEARAHLFYNISIVVNFKQAFPMKGGGSVD